MATRLSEKECVPCRGGVPPVQGEELERLLEELDSGWRVVDGHHLEKEFEFEDWAGAQAFVNRVGDLAEEQGHHPDLHLSWGRVGVQLWTHKIDGITESDFVMAAKIEEV
jgi:4a-hydroxytetrahydrobiopterin dehydratase